MKKALIIIDVQNDYFPNGKFELHNSEGALTKIKLLVDEFRKKDNPIYFVKHISSKDGTFFVPDTHGVEIHDGIKPLDSEKIIIKNYPNSFLKTTLEEELEKESVTDLIICGMMTHLCVDTTVRAAANYDYNITLISDACATRSLEWNSTILPAETVQNVYMASLNNIFCKVITCNNYLNISEK